MNAWLKYRMESAALEHWYGQKARAYEMMERVCQYVVKENEDGPPKNPAR